MVLFFGCWYFEAYVPLRTGQRSEFFFWRYYWYNVCVCLVVLRLYLVTSLRWGRQVGIYVDGPSPFPWISCHVVP